MAHETRRANLIKKHNLKGVNKPKRTPDHKTKSHIVLAQEGHKLKLIRFGQQGVSGAGKKPKTASEKARKRSFKARHAKNIKKGIDTRPMFKELESVIDYGATMQQRINMRAEGMKYKVERGYESKDLDAQKNTFLDNQKRSLESGKETALYSIDKHLFNNDGSLKYKTLNEFKANATDYAGAWSKIFGERGVFDTQFKQGMIA